MTYKFGAILGRNTQLRTGFEFDYYRSKLWKDVYDVITLTQLEINTKKVNKFLNESGLVEYAKEIFQIIEDNFDVELKSLLNNISLSDIRKILIDSGDDPVKTSTSGVYNPHY